MSVPAYVKSPAKFRWPIWICGAWSDARQDICSLPARWQSRPISRSPIVRLWCDRCRPENAERIPNDAPFAVTRMEMRIAATGAPGDPVTAEHEVLQRMIGAIEMAGGLVVAARALDDRADSAPAAAPRFRLEFADSAERLAESFTSMDQLVAVVDPFQRRWWRGR